MVRMCLHLCVLACVLRCWREVAIKQSIKETVNDGEKNIRLFESLIRSNYLCLLSASISAVNNHLVIYSVHIFNKDNDVNLKILASVELELFSNEY